MGSLPATATGTGHRTKAIWHRGESRLNAHERWPKNDFRNGRSEIGRLSARGQGSVMSVDMYWGTPRRVFRFSNGGLHDELRELLPQIDVVIREALRQEHCADVLNGAVELRITW